MAVGALHGVPLESRHEAAAVTVVLLLVGADVAALAALLGPLGPFDAASGRLILLAAIFVWAANVVAFGLVCWELDRCDLRWRRLPASAGGGDWGVPPRLLDYLYLSFASAIAFSPTGAMPVSHRARLVALVESGLSVATVLALAARAVEIHG